MAIGVKYSDKVYFVSIAEFPFLTSLNLDSKQAHFIIHVSKDVSATSFHEGTVFIICHTG